jgi:transposase
VNDHKGALLILSAIPNAREPLADKGYDSDWFRAALTERGIAPVHSAPQKPQSPISLRQGPHIHRQRHKIENVFGRIKNWCRVATRYDRYAHTFMSAISIAAICYYCL